MFKQPSRRGKLSQIDFGQFPSQLREMISELREKSISEGFDRNQPSVCKIVTEQDEPDIDVNKLFEPKNGAVYLKAHQSLISSFPQRFDEEGSKNLLHEF